MSHLTLAIKDQDQVIKYEGILVKKTPSRVMFQTKFGLMDLPIEDLVSLEPSNETNYEQSQGPVKEKEGPVQDSTRQYGHREGNSRFNQAVTIYRNLMIDGQHPQRKQVIDAFVAQIGMTTAGASTYQQNVKNAIVKGTV